MTTIATAFRGPPGAGLRAARQLLGSLAAVALGDELVRWLIAYAGVAPGYFAALGASLRPATQA